ncbi:hypothetical protein HDU96_007622 [Phlyctochytrium bullatum]|nr:hypothetical protein HDU96_007622 [Phlyctochytrium bullatum]
MNIKKVLALVASRQASEQVAPSVAEKAAGVSKKKDAKPTEEISALVIASSAGPSTDKKRKKRKNKKNKGKETSADRFAPATGSTGSALNRGDVGSGEDAHAGVKYCVQKTLETTEKGQGKGNPMMLPETGAPYIVADQNNVPAPTTEKGRKANAAPTARTIAGQESVLTLVEEPLTASRPPSNGKPLVKAIKTANSIRMDALKASAKTSPVSENRKPGVALNWALAARAAIESPKKWAISSAASSNIPTPVDNPFPALRAVCSRSENQNAEKNLKVSATAQMNWAVAAKAAVKSSVEQRRKNISSAVTGTKTTIKTSMDGFPALKPATRSPGDPVKERNMHRYADMNWSQAARAKPVGHHQQRPIAAAKTTKTADDFPPLKSSSPREAVPLMTDAHQMDWARALRSKATPKAVGVRQGARVV